jgi:hypothetical protein
MKKRSSGAGYDGTLGHVELGWVVGLEPTTAGATVRSSTTELHPPHIRNASRAEMHRQTNSTRTRVRTKPFPFERPRLALLTEYCPAKKLEYWQRSTDEFRVDPWRFAGAQSRSIPD